MAPKTGFARLLVPCLALTSVEAFAAFALGSKASRTALRVTDLSKTSPESLPSLEQQLAWPAPDSGLPSGTVGAASAVQFLPVDPAVAVPEQEILALSPEPPRGRFWAVRALLARFRGGTVAPPPAFRPAGAGTAAARGPREVPAARHFVSNIGSTPLVELTTLAPDLPPNVRILLKCEFMNPGNSIKDRIAEHILNDAESRGVISKGSTVVAASSGNTAAAFAMLCAARGYKAVVITNTKCSKEKVDALTAFGATAIVTKAGVPPSHPEHYQRVEDRLVAENEGWFGVNQYDNPLNPEAYYKTLAPEIWRQAGGEVTHLFAAASTGGTITGIGRFLKEKNPACTVVCPDPVGSIFTSFFKAGAVDEATGSGFEVEGVGKDSIPKAMDFGLIDAMPPVTDKEAFAMCRRLASEEGLVCGGSTGLNVHAAVQYAKTNLAGPGAPPATIVCIAPDAGIKYLSKIYNDEWMASKGFL